MIAAMVPFPAFPLPEAIAWLALPWLALAAQRDVAVRRIPNVCAVAIALIGAMRQAMSGGPALLQGLFAAAVVLLLTGGLWFRGLFGGGDVKMLSAATLLVPPGQVFALLLSVALAGGLLCVLHLSLRVALPRRAVSRAPSGSLRRVLRAEAWRIGRRAPLPYGVAIAAGAAFLIVAPGG